MQRTSPTIDGVELRVRDLSVDNLTQADGIEFALRVPLLDNPWLADAQERAWWAEAQHELRELDHVALEHEVERCVRSIDLQVHGLHEALYADTMRELDPIEAWLEAWRDAGSLDELATVELELELAVWRVEELPVPRHGAPPDDTAESWPLPDPARTADPPLQNEDDVVAQQIRAHHPEVATHLAQAEAYRLEYERESVRGWPWLDFVEIGYRLADQAGPEHITAQLAIAIPFGLESGAEAVRHETLELSETLAAEGVVEDHLRDALDALAVLRRLEASRDALGDLIEVAERAEDVARRWSEQRLGQPRQVARVLQAAYAARLHALRARQLAGEASCVLLAATGTPLSAWPRE